MDEIFRVFADSINGVPNATNAADASLEDIPEFREFLAAVEPLDEMEDAGNLLFAASERKAESEMVVYVQKSARDSVDFHTFAKNFNLDPSKGSYRVRIGLDQRSNDELVIATRPLSGAPWSQGNPAQITWNIPNDPTLLGLTLYTQGVVLDFGVNLAALTQAALMFIGV